MGYRLGVDLGTTWTAASAFDGDAVTPIRLGANSAAIPSAVAFVDDQTLVGESANKRIAVDPTCGAREMKRRLGDTTPFVLAGTPYSPEALLGRVLAHVVEVSAQQLGPADSVVLTHPATWGPFKIDLLAEAARVAGLGSVGFVAEPIAAASHYARLGKVASGATVAVYDFGGGTFDAAIVRNGEQGLEIVGAAEGLDRLGGVDFDQAVLAHVVAALDGQLDNLDHNDPDVRTSLAALRDECVAAKEALSSDTDAAISVAFPSLSTEVRITRAEFEAAIRPRVQETLDALDRTLAAAAVNYDDLAAILLVGGSSRIPLVAEMLSAHTGRPIAVDVDTKAVVCCGAAAWAASTVASPGAIVADGDSATSAATKGVSATPTNPATKQGSGTARKVGRAAAVGAAGLAVSGAVVAGAAAAYAATQGDDGPSLQTSAPDGPDTSDDATGSVADEGADGRVAGRAASLDVFDEVTAAPTHVASAPNSPLAGAASGAQTPLQRTTEHRDGDVQTNQPTVPVHRTSDPVADTPSPRVEPASVPYDDSTPGASTPRTPETPGSSETPGNSNDNLDPRVMQVQQALRDHLESWKPPAGATEQEVRELQKELAGMIDRFDPADGVSFENAAGDLQQRLDDSLEDFSQAEQLDRSNEAQRAAAVDAQHDAAANAEFRQYVSALEDFANDWDPAQPLLGEWIDQGSLEKFKTEQIPGIMAGIRFNPDASLRLQQQHAEQVMRDALKGFQQSQFASHHTEHTNEISIEMKRLEFIKNDQTASAEDRSQAETDLFTLRDQQKLENSVWEDARVLPVTNDPAADAALHANLEPDADGGREMDAQASLMVDRAEVATERASGHAAMLADVFDDEVDAMDTVAAVSPSFAATAHESGVAQALADPAGAAAVITPMTQQTMSAVATEADAADDLMADDILGVAHIAATVPSFAAAALPIEVAGAADAPIDAFAPANDVDPVDAFSAAALTNDVTSLNEDDAPSMLDDPLAPVMDTDAEDQLGF